MRSPAGARPFAAPLYWRNSTPDDRLPIRERLPARRIGLADIVPVPDRRDGLTPYLSFAGIAQTDSAGEPSSDLFPTLAFGVDYRALAPLGLVLAGYSVEVAGAEGSEEGIDTHGGFLALSRQLGPQTTATGNLFYSQIADLRSLPAQDFARDATTIETGGLAVNLSHRLNPRFGLDLGLTLQNQATDATASPDVVTRGVSALVWGRPAETRRVAGSVDLRAVSFGVEDATLGDAALSYTIDLGPRLAATGEARVLWTDFDGGHVFPGLGGEIVTSWQNARLRVGAARDMVTVAGFGAPILTDSLDAALEMRFGHGFLGVFTATQQWLDPLDNATADIDVTSLEGQLSQAVSDSLWLWGRLQLSRETTEDSRRDFARISIGLSRSLD